MEEILQTGLMLVAIVAAVAMVARRAAIPSPILFVITGAGLSFLPGMPQTDLKPDLVLLLFLPPLVYSAAYATSWLEFQANLRPIVLLAVGLVLFSTVATAAIANGICGLAWPLAFVLGAIVAPPDEVAAIAVFERLGVPRRIVILLKGEGLINDATALTMYRFAAASVAAGSVSLSRAALFFAAVILGETAWGLLIGWLFSELRSRVQYPAVEITLSLLIPFAAYLPVERLGGTGVLAVTAAGLFISWRGPLLISFRTRLKAGEFWDMIVFLLDGLLFLLTGLQMRHVIQRLAIPSWPTLIGYGVLISAAVVLLRFLWVYTATYLPRALIPSLKKRDPAPGWQHAFLISWSGMRGGVSLAAALAIPLTIRNGQPFPERDLLIFLTLFVIVTTLVFQGLSLPWLIRWLKLDDVRGAEIQNLLVQENQARIAVAEAALTRINQVAKEKHPPHQVVESIRDRYHDRIDHLRRHADGRLDANHQELDRWTQELRKQVLGAERHKLIGMRNEGAISDEVLHRIERELDLEEARWDRQDAPSEEEQH